MIFWAGWLGGFIRWLLKGCKTDYLDEINGNLEPRFLKSYEIENYIIGFVSVALFITIIVLILF